MARGLKTPALTGVFNRLMFGFSSATFLSGRLWFDFKGKFGLYCGFAATEMT
jgi:hypothetical protein